MLDLVTIYTLIALVLIMSGLASGVIERAPLSFPIIFLGLGFLLGGHGLGIIEIGPESVALEAIAFLVLALTLFLDAVRLRIGEVSAAGLTPMLSLGPGTVIIIAVIALGSHFLLELSVVESLLVGTILASTDPVILRDVVRDERIPRSIRRALSIEAGTNDLVVLPALLILIAVANAEVDGIFDWLVYVGQVFVLGPVVGFVVGAAGAWIMSKADAKFGIRREYQALYGIGLVLLAFATGQLSGGDGFLAAFAAGLAVALLNFDLCDCFLEYGETTVEAAMLLTFTLFGVVISEVAFEVPLVPTLVLAALAIFVARPLAIALVLRRAYISRPARALIGWFGPRGLNSLLLALLVLQNDVLGAEFLLAIVGVVVTVSVVVHGATATPLSSLYARVVERTTLEEERESTAAGLFTGEEEASRISPQELAEILEGPNPLLVLDVRTRSQYDRDRTRIPGSIRVLPDQVQDWGMRYLAEHHDGEPHLPPIATYCT